MNQRSSRRNLLQDVVLLKVKGGNVGVMGNRKGELVSRRLVFSHLRNELPLQVHRSPWQHLHTYHAEPSPAMGDAKRALRAATFNTAIAETLAQSVRLTSSISKQCSAMVR